MNDPEPEHRQPSQHHYVPIFYLKYWAGSDGKVVRWNRPIDAEANPSLASTIVERRVHPSRVGWERNLYASPNETELGEQWLEAQIFQQVDSLAAPVLAMLNSRNPFGDMTGDQLSAWTVFIRSMLHRSPYALRKLKAQGAALWADTIREAYTKFAPKDDEGRPIPFEQFASNYTADEVERSVIRYVPEMLMNARLGQFINDLNYRVVVTPPDCRPFLLSDDFLVRTNGLANETGHIAMPISPHRVLIGAYRRPLLDYFISLTPKELAKAINTWVVESARHFVVGADMSQDRFIRNHFGRIPREPVTGVSSAETAARGLSVLA